MTFLYSMKKNVLDMFSFRRIVNKNKEYIVTINMLLNKEYVVLTSVYDSISVKTHNIFRLR